LTYDEGRSEKLLRNFYSLLILTRRRHGVPPQPLSWFRNVIAGLKDKVVIRVALKDGQPVASTITISFKDVMIYKYGCSDSRFNNLGGTALLFWRAIQDAKRSQAVKFDFGRSELNNSGLITFKENWGAISQPLNYLRFSADPSQRSSSDWTARVAKNLFSRMPNALLTATGKLLYRHIG
jgi:lipid II:glycine glycyltransferase (peptidoglycan interpeptide bridge formation enzyme)